MVVLCGPRAAPKHRLLNKMMLAKQTPVVTTRKRIHGSRTGSHRRATTVIPKAYHRLETLIMLPCARSR